MYLHAWKSGLKTTYYLRSRPATRIQQATVAVAAPPRAGRRGGRRLLPGEPRDLRGLPVTARPPHRPHGTAAAMLLDPGMDLTLRPMRYPQFYDRFRDAIKNTWTVEEVDLHSDLADLARLSPAERHLVSRLVAFFATGDTIVANNLVLNLYQHINSPEGAAVPVPAAVRGGRARAVLPDPARHLRAGRDGAGAGVRRGREHPLDRAQGRVLLHAGSTRSTSCASCAPPPTGARSCST